MKLAEPLIKSIVESSDRWTFQSSFPSHLNPVLIFEISNLRCIHVSVTYVCYVNVINRKMTTSVTFNVKQSLFRRCYIRLCFIPRNRHSTFVPTYHMDHNNKCCAAQ